MNNNIESLSIKLYTDGGSRGNPGEAAIGYVLYNSLDDIIYECGKPIGIATNNVAEYKALIEGMKKCLNLGINHISLFMDSELIVKQIKKEYKVKNEELKRLYDQAMILISKCKRFEIRHVRRENNKEADRMVNLALDKNSVYEADYTMDDPILAKESSHSLQKADQEEKNRSVAVHPDLEGKVEALNNIIRTDEKVLVAFSGGVDSSLLLRVCHDVLGKKAYAATIIAANISSEEIETVEEFVKQTGITHQFIYVDIFGMENFVKNEEDRCYICKKHLFQKLKNCAETLGITAIYDGSNRDDLTDYRPGLKALEEMEIRSPLMEAGFTKEDVRSYSKNLGLDTFDKEAMACLVTRIPYGQRITDDKLKQIEASEKVLRDLGYRQVRVRSYDQMARIEMFEEDISRFMDSQDYRKVNQKLKELGFKYVTLDIEGYRRGSMNLIQAMTPEEKR